MSKPVLFVTRRLPPAVEARAARDYDARLNPEDTPRTGADIVRLASGASAILCCPAEQVDAETIAALPDSVRVIATFSVGFDHIAIEAAKARGIAVCNTPEVLSLNAPGGGSTRHWLNAARIARLPKGAVVVNAARGTLVDDAALIAALKSGQVGYAGLDVYNGEPKLNPGYLDLENVVLLPHLGSATTETREAMGFLALDGIDAVLAGRKPKNLVV